MVLQEGFCDELHKQLHNNFNGSVSQACLLTIKSIGDAPVVVRRR